MIRVAAIQMTSSGELAANLSQAERLIAQAANDGAQLVVLPEYFAYQGCRDLRVIALAEQHSGGPARQFLAEQAAKHGIWIVGGTIPVFPENADPEENTRAYAACFLMNPAGNEVARYNKIHLFDVDVDDAKGSYRESDDYLHGSDLVVADTELGKIGLSVCYDLRFPELYQQLARRGADILIVPAAFTAVTGAAHWKLLLRARAVENVCYVVGADMGDREHLSRPTWGGSAIVGPWGEVLAEAVDGEAVVIADIDFDRQRELRKKMPVHEHHRLSGVKS